MNAATLHEIADALGVNHSTAARWAGEQSWPIEEHRSGRGRPRKMVALHTLPTPIRTAVEEHRALAHVERCAGDLLDWAHERRVLLTAEQRADRIVLGKLLSARAVEAHPGNPGSEGAGSFSIESLYAVLARRYDQPVVSIQRWIDEAQGWLSRAATLAPTAPVVTLDAGEERRFAIAFWRAQIIAPIVAEAKWSKPRAAALKRIAAVPHMGPDGKMVKITAATLYHWCDLYELHGGLEALKPKIREDKGGKRVTLSRNFDTLCPLPLGDTENPTPGTKAQIAAEMATYIRSGWAEGVSGWRDLKIKAERKAREICRQQGWNPPAGEEWVGRRFIEEYRGAGIVAIKRNDAKRYCDEFLPRVRRTAASLRPMALVVGDVHPLDIAIDMPDGRRVYPRLITWHDLATNRLHVTMIFLRKGEGVRREHIAQSFAAMVEAWGLPERLYLDNGREYSWDEMMKAFVDLARLTGRVRAEWLSMGPVQEREAVAAARRSGGAHDPEGHITQQEIHRAKPYNAPAKPVEGLFSVIESTVFSMIPGWVGGDRVRKKTQNVGQEPAAFPGGESELFHAVDTALAYYHRKAQHGWLDGKSPIEMYARHIAEGWQRVECNPQALLLSFAETYTPQADRGTVTVNGTVYYADAILPYTGQKLPVKVARHDPRTAFVFDPKTSKLIAAASPDKAYDFRDPRGAEEQGRRAKWLSRYVAEIAESCVRLDLVEEMRKVVEEGPALPVAPVGATVEASEQVQAMRRALEDHQDRKARERQAALPGAPGTGKANSLWSAYEDEDPLIAGLVFLDDDETLTHGEPQ